MRIVIDLQGAQGINHDRGIGRYALALALGIVRNRGSHDIRICLSDLFPHTIEPLRDAFVGSLPRESIHVWCAEPEVANNNASNAFRSRIAEAQREAFLASLRPDMVLVTSLFEGFFDNIVTSINEHSSIPTAVVLYDLIPFIYKDVYLMEPKFASWYYEKVRQLKQADLLLADSESSRGEGIDLLDIDPERIVGISASVDSRYAPRKPSTNDVERLRKQYGLARDFVMYTGGLDWRKNIEGLIRAYARLPYDLRVTHQLAIVCAAQSDARLKLELYANEVGLSRDELVVTGFVSDDDLLTLYNLCKAFVFPSLHEGFGLPALEAMQCGKAVIASQTSSLPEVVGRSDALFDPRDDAAIAGALERVLQDRSFREDLERHGSVQAAKFSWDKTATRAIGAIEAAVGRLKASKVKNSTTNERKRLAYFSPLPPEQSGISDYSVELLRILNRFYKIDVIVNQPPVSNEWIAVNCRQRDAKMFRNYAHEYDRVLYHFGNSHFHENMYDLLSVVPGVVVLHDFFLSGLLEYKGRNVFMNALLKSHGYYAAATRHISMEKAIYTYPGNISVIQNSIGIIVHSHEAIKLASQWYGATAGEDWSLIPLLRESHTLSKSDRTEARQRLRLSDNEILICNFGIVAPTKLNDALVNAYCKSTLVSNALVKLVFVGLNAGGPYGDNLVQAISNSPCGERIKITGWIDREEYLTYLNAADFAVQLRGFSRGESSLSVLDCMSHGLPTVVNANGSMAEIDRDGVWMLDDRFNECELVDALERMAEDKALRDRIGRRAREIIQERHSPVRCGALYFEAIEEFYGRHANGVDGLLSRLSSEKVCEAAVRGLASTLARNFPPRPRLRQLLVDVSALVLHDLRTGIERVVRSILSRWLLDPPQGWAVEPVYATLERPGYRYARNYTCRVLAIDNSWTEDEEVDAWAGDIFIGMDFTHTVLAQRETLDRWYRAGVEVRFVVYDLLPVRLPSCFPEGAMQIHTNWLETVTRFTGAVCISQTVARQLHEWCQLRASPRTVPFEINWFHLGADIRQSNPTAGMPHDANLCLSRMNIAPTFLMVGTIEPRKGHGQALSALELLWKDGIDVNLVIVGRQGWMVDDVVERIKGHRAFGVHIFWPENVSDEFLEKIYAASTCLLAASEDEGFGLPLIEAAQHGLPIVARDLPVFREVAGDHAFYFHGREPQSLASALAEWLELYQENSHVPSTGITWLTWAQSADMLLSRLGIEGPPSDQSVGSRNRELPAP